jgi:hypothetical protein
MCSAAGRAYYDEHGGYCLSCAVQAAHHRKPGLLERYAIFIREQQHTQKAGDVVSFVEMMRNYRMVHRVHKEALLATVSSF